MIQAELFQGNLKHIVVLSIMLNRFPSMSFSLRSTVKQKEKKIKSRLTCYVLCIFAEWPLDFYHDAGFLCALET